MKLEPSCWPSELASIRLKDLYRLYEMTKLTQSMVSEEPLPKHSLPRSRYRHPSRLDIEKVIWKDIEQTCERIWGADFEPDFPWFGGGKEIGGYMDFIVLWDHWESDLKGISCSPQRQVPERVEKESFADDTSDGEFDM